MPDRLPRRTPFCVGLYRRPPPATMGLRFVSRTAIRLTCRPRRDSVLACAGKPSPADRAPSRCASEERAGAAAGHDAATHRHRLPDAGDEHVLADPDDAGGVRNLLYPAW